MTPPIIYHPNFVPNPDEAFAALRDELAWERRAPRSEYYSNDFPKPYVYGRDRGQRLYETRPFHPVMLAIRQLVEEAAKATLEVSFLNKYEGPSDSLFWHADDSPEMDDARPIGIISLGIEREIWFMANNAAKGSQPFKMKLGHGSLCLMLPGMQNTWKHRIPKAGFVCNEKSPFGGVRISITLRGYVLQKDPPC